MLKSVPYFQAAGHLAQFTSLSIVLFFSEDIGTLCYGTQCGNELLTSFVFLQSFIFMRQINALICVSIYTKC